MVLKFCGGLWDASRTDDDLDALASRQRRLQELLREGTVSSRQAARFQKEVRVVFDSTRPHGIAFVDDDDTLRSHGYACRVASVDATARGQAAEYNKRCQTIGDYAHMLVSGMHVRSVDSLDMKGVPYDTVLGLIAKGSAGVGGSSITFADVSSAPVSPKPKLKTVGTLVLAAQRTQKPPAKITQPPVSPTRRSVFNANASPKVSKWSSVLTAVTDSARANQSDVLASDLTKKNAHLESQLLILKGKLGALEREKAALEKAREETVHGSTVHLQSLQTEQQDLQTELDNAKQTCSTLSEQRAALEAENSSMRIEVETLNTAIATLQHEHDTVLLHMHELQTEHRDLQHQAEELHNRLVAAQLVKSELNEQLTLLKHERGKDLAALTAIQTELSRSSESNGPASPAKPRVPNPGVLEQSSRDSPTIAWLKQTIQSRNALQKQHDELHIELSCHENTIHDQQDRILELEEKLAAVTQINDSLKDQVRSLLAIKGSTDQEPSGAVKATEPVDVTSPSEFGTLELQRQLDIERSTNARIQSALQALEDKARAKLELHAKEQLFLSQFKEQLVKGITVVKYGTRGSPHPRVLYSDAQCRWISWRAPSDGSTSPRADAKAETLDLVEVLLGATTETFVQHKPEVPARCLSLVFCRPCRTLDVEVETRDRALFLRRGFRLLLEEAGETRHHLEDGN